MQRTVTFVYERDGNDVCVFADLPGYYLWASDVERAFANVIPLAQHVIWRNEQLPMVPAHDLNIEELLNGKTTVSFKLVTQMMRAPTLTIDGEWWTNKEGTNFFVPVENGMMSERVLEKMKEDF